MNSDEIAYMMSKSYSMHGDGLTCAEAAGAMAAVLARVQPRVVEEDFNLLVVLGGVLFREGLREFEAAKKAREAIHRARRMEN